MGNNPSGDKKKAVPALTEKQIQKLRTVWASIVGIGGKKVFKDH